MGCTSSKHNLGGVLNADLIDDSIRVFMRRDGSCKTPIDGLHVDDSIHVMRRRDEKKGRVEYVPARVHPLFEQSFSTLETMSVASMRSDDEEMHASS